jgi:hypothetical protein
LQSPYLSLKPDTKDTHASTDGQSFPVPLFGEANASSCARLQFMKDIWLSLSDGNAFPEKSGKSRCCVSMAELLFGEARLMSAEYYSEEQFLSVTRDTWSVGTQRASGLAPNRECKTSLGMVLKLTDSHAPAAF